MLLCPADDECRKVSDSFFADDTAGEAGKVQSAKFKLCVASPTWLVQMESPGVRKVYHYPNGFRFLNFNSVHGQTHHASLSF